MCNKLCSSNIRIASIQKGSVKDSSLKSVEVPSTMGFTQKFTRMLLPLIAVFLAAVDITSPAIYSNQDIGIPAGLLPDCPGILKNASISLGSMQALQLLHYRMSSKGAVLRTTMPLMEATKMLKKDNFIDLKNKKTVLYAVGFWDSSVFPHSQAVAHSYAKRGYNVFISETFSFLTYIYPKSVRLSRVLGKKFGEFLVKLHHQGLDPDKLQLVGISLGAHIVAYAAKHFYEVTGKKPARLTGLDPAGPCFRTMPREYRLNKDDATQVDVIHTNIDGFGMAEPMGHIDYYANGGEFQPSDIPYIPCLIICSHLRSILYWWQAIEHPKKFIGLKCDSVQDARFANCYNSTDINYFGFDADFNKPGIYYLPTSNEFPYYRGKEGLKRQNEIFTSFVSGINSDDGFTV